MLLRVKILKKKCNFTPPLQLTTKEQFLLFSILMFPYSHKQETKSFLLFSGSIDNEHWHEMDQLDKGKKQENENDSWL